MGASIERFRGDDEKALLELLLRLDEVDRRHRFGRCMTDAQLRDYAAGINLNRDVMLVAREGPRIFGACHLSVHQDESGFPAGELGVCVDDSRRRKGWGRRLVTLALEVARRRHVVRVRIQHLRRDLAMARLVGRLGVQARDVGTGDVEAWLPLMLPDPAQRVRRRFAGPLEVFDTAPSRPRGHVVFIHGAGGDAWQWRQWLQPELTRRGYATTALSLRDHGGSVRGARAGADEHLADVCGVLQELPAQPILVGHSMGGYLAQRVAEQVRLRRLVLLASIAPQPPDERELARMQRAMEAPHGRAVLGGVMNGARPVDPVRVQAPVTVAGGARDRVVPMPRVEATARAYGVPARRLERSGHVPMLGGQWRDLVRLCTYAV